MNNSPNSRQNSNNFNNTYSMDAVSGKSNNVNRNPNPAPQQQRPRPQNQRPPLTDEERRRIAAARAAGTRMNSSASGSANGAPRQSNGYGQRPVSSNGQRPMNNAGQRPGNPNGQPRPNPNNPNYRPQNPNPAQRRPVSPDRRTMNSYTGRRRRRRIRINFGAVIFVLMIGMVVGVSAYQISKMPEVPESGDLSRFEEILRNPQNEQVPNPNPGSGSSDTLDGSGSGSSGSLNENSSDENIVTPAQNLTLYDAVTVRNDTIDEGKLVLVNFNYEYAKINDVALKIAYTDRTSAIKVASTTLGMDPEAFDALETLFAGLVADTGCDDLLLYSGHRTMDDQQRIWDSNMTNYGEEYTRTYVAVPGHSEHHTGLACDLSFYTDDGASVPLVDHEYGSWVQENCTDYGYILRYPADKSEITGIGHEQWHFRYVGLAHAYAVDALGYCYEEYVDALKSYTVDTKLLHISPEGTLTDVNIADLSAVSGGWLTYFVPASSGDTTDVKIPRGDKFSDYEISGNNVDGFIVTITLP